MSRRPVRVCVFGYFDRGNVGDNAMRDAFRAYIAERCSDLDIDWRPLPEWTVSQSWLMAKMAWSMAVADVALLLGGTHFHDAFRSRSHRILASFLGAFLLARGCRTRIGLVGIGVGPLDTRLGRSLTRLNIGLSNAVLVRDQESLNLLSRIHAAQSVIDGFDIASLAPLPRLVEGDDPGTLGVSIVPYFASFCGNRTQDDAFVAKLADALRRYHEAGAFSEVKVLIFADSSVDGDRSISRRLLSALTGCVPARMIDCTRPADAFREVSTTRWMLASRFHAIMFTYLLGLPMVAIPYQPKCSALTLEIGLAPAAIVSPVELLESERFDRALADLFSGDPACLATVPVQTSRDRSRRSLDAFMDRVLPPR